MHRLRCDTFCKLQIDFCLGFCLCYTHYMGGKQTYHIKPLPRQNMPREMLASQGPDVLKNAELLAIIFGTGYKQENVLELASRILKEYGSKAITRERSVARLMGELGLPKVKASQIIACFELGRRFYQEDTSRMPTIRGADDVFNYLKDIQNAKKEIVRGLYLNVRNKLIHDEVISIGTLSENVAHPREVFGPAFEFSAAGVIIAHNHPSGDVNPSDKDKSVTQQLINAGKIIDIILVDHVIVGNSSYFSFKEKQMM